MPHHVKPAPKSLAALAATALLAAQAQAEPPAQSRVQEAPAPDNGRLESVIVTANKRAQNLQDVFSVAAFRTDFRDFQQSAGFFDYDGIFRTALNSIGGLRTQGLEIEGSMRATRPLQLNGSFAYTRATIREFRNGPCYNVLNAEGTAAVPGPGCYQSPEFNNTNVQDLAGKTLPNAPRLKLNLGGQLELPLPALPFDGFVSGTTRFQSRTQYSLNQDPNTIQDAYGITNLAFGAVDRKGRWKASLFVNNLFDKQYAAGLNSAIANSTWSPKAPNVALAVNTTEWLPPRDYHRYVGARADVTF